VLSHERREKLERKKGEEKKRQEMPGRITAESRVLSAALDAHFYPQVIHQLADHAIHSQIASFITHVAKMISQDTKKIEKKKSRVEEWN
jgi:hypothetical protein